MFVPSKHKIKVNICFEIMNKKWWINLNCLVTVKKKRISFYTYIIRSLDCTLLCVLLLFSCIISCHLKLRKDVKKIRIECFFLSSLYQKIAIESNKYKSMQKQQSYLIETTKQSNKHFPIKSFVFRLMSDKIEWK